HRPFCALCARRGVCSLRPRRNLRARVSGPRGLPPNRRPARRRCGRRGARASRGARRFCRVARQSRKTKHGLVHARRAPHAARGAGVDGQRRDDRQRLDQPARRAEQSRRAGRAPLRIAVSGDGDSLARDRMSIAGTEPSAVPHIRPVRLGPQDVHVERRADGTLLLTSPQPLALYPTKITERLEFWAREAPDRIFMAQRDDTGAWRTVTYAQALRHARAIGTTLLRRGLSAERPVVILSGNSIEHALIALGALYAGIPHAPVSPAYSLVSADFSRLRAIIDLLTPGLVLAADGAAFAHAVAAVVPESAEVVVSRNAPHGRRA